MTTHLSALKPAVLRVVVNFAISTQTDIITSVIQKKKKRLSLKAKDKGAQSWYLKLFWPHKITFELMKHENNSLLT